MKKVGFYIALVALLTACSANKYLPEGEKYFEGHEIEYVDGKENIPKYVQNELDKDFKPKATRRFFMSRPGTWLYQSIESPQKDKGVKHWIKYKLGSAPSYLSSLDSQKNERILRHKLANNGFFRSSIETRIDSSKHKAKAVYLITLHEPYYLDTIYQCQDTTEICKIIDEFRKEKTVLQQEDLYSTAKLKEERKNITRELRDRGYYYYSSDYLYFLADSNDGEKKVRLKLDQQKDIPPAFLKPYTLSEASLNLAVNSKNTVTLGDSLKVVVDTNQLFIDPIKLKPFVAYRPGELYSKLDEELTLKQLNHLEVFQFVNVQYVEDSASTIPSIKARLLATPRRKHSLRTEFNLSTTSTNFTGPGLQTEYYNRNLFRGAEKLRVTAIGRYETQLSGSRKGLDSYEVDLQASLYFPRLGGILRSKKRTGFIPKTKYRVQYRLYNQPEYYAQTSSSFSYGFEWLRDRYTQNEYRLVSFDYVRLLESSDRLEELFDQNILSRESFEDQVILGSSYSFSHSPPYQRNRSIRSYFGGSVEIAGNLLNGISEIGNFSKNENGQYTFAGVPYAQYFRMQADYRFYFKWSKYNELVIRQNVGLGIPYSNSTALPFSKQFFVGGASSLRGFQARSIGPGTYRNEELGDESFFDQSGDILIETNFENRFDMGPYFEGAVFVDLGNVWLKNASEARPGGEFNFDTFLSQMAVNTGFGVRLNLDFVIVRLDLGIPLSIPYRAEGDKWVGDKMSFSRDYRKDYLIWNLAIGYPF